MNLITMIRSHSWTFSSILMFYQDCWRSFVVA